MVPALLSAEITARTGRDPGEQYRSLSQDLGAMYANRVDAAANAEQKQKLGRLDRAQVRITELAGEPIEQVLTRAPGNNAALGGVKVTSRGGWFAARPSGTEDIYKIYAESFHDAAHLDRLIAEAQRIVDAALAAA
jgi:phosphoglucomutase